MLSGVLLLVLLFAVGVSADSFPRDQEREIEHLLDFVKHSDCTFVRNNSVYNGARAREHIQKKYIRVKKKIKELSAEQFIRYAASRSSWSQKLYLVHCGVRTISSESWLLEELEYYRQSSTVHSSDIRAQ